MKATENRLRSEPAETLDRPMAWRSLARGRMRLQFDAFAVRCNSRKDPAQAGLANDDDVIETFPVHRADHSFRMPFCQGDLAAIGYRVYPWPQDAS